MKKSSILTQESLDDLLQWLDRDRDCAGQKYEQIRRALIKIFAARGCTDAEDLADETLTRVAGKAKAMAAIYKGDPALFFFGVAKNVHHEYSRSLDFRLHRSADESAIQLQGSALNATAHESEVEARQEARLKCMMKCLQSLPDGQRELVTHYYEKEKGAKIENRKALAERYGLTINALRLKAHRLRQSLRECVVKCLEECLT